VTHFYLLVALATLVLLLFLYNLSRAWRRQALPFVLGKALFSPQEALFLAALEEALGGDYRIFGKLRLVDLLTGRRGAGKRSMRQSAASIEHLTIDFLVCGRDSLGLVCAVNLVGAKGEAARRRAADKALGRACEVLGLPLVRVPVAEAYAAKVLAEQIYAAVYAPRVTPPAGAARGLRADDGPSRADEEQALSVLAAAIREGDPVPRPRAS
jgi:hypothetical protein